MKKNEWWRGTATHMWRLFFAINRNKTDLSSLTESARYIYNTCYTVYTEKLSAFEQDAIRTYASSRWEDTIRTVESYAAQNTLQLDDVWNAIRKTNRITVETLGLIDRKDDDYER